MNKIQTRKMRKGSLWSKDGAEFCIMLKILNAEMKRGNRSKNGTL